MITINGMNFEPKWGVKYKYNYVKIFEKVQRKEWDELSTWRKLVLNDLWFVVYFVLKIPVANHKFVVELCKEVEAGPRDFTLDLLAREHFKTTVITTAETIQDILRDKEERIAIISYSQKASLKIFRPIKYILETSELLKSCFPEVLYQNPETEAWKWSEDAGLWVKRESAAREATLECWSLLEGMPTGAHFTKIVYDDVETADSVNTPEMIQRLKDAFDLSLNLGAEGGRHRVIGTTYHYDGLLEYLKAKRNANDEPLYHTRIKTATHDGTFNGRPVYLSKKRLDTLKSNPRIFAAQQLLNPASIGAIKLDPEHLIKIRPDDIPKNLLKFIVIDQAGVSQRKDRQDAWAILCIGVEPIRDDLGNSNIYLLDGVVSPLLPAQALDEVVKMYLRNGRVRGIAVEKVGLSTTEVHIANALRAKGKFLTVENKGIIILMPGGRKKEVRIESNLQWPLMNGKIHYSAEVSFVVIERIKTEMAKFPVWHNDALDSLSYFYDILRNYRFGAFQEPKEVVEDVWMKKRRIQQSKYGWMSA